MPCVFLVGESHTVYAYVAAFNPLLAVCRKRSTSPLSTRESDIFLADRPFAGVSLDVGTRSQMLNYHLHMSSHVESDGSKRR